MVDVVFNCDVKCPFSKNDVLAVARVAAKKEKKIRGMVEITVVSPSTIRKLNKKYRGKDKVTDVLSFSMVEGLPVSGPFLGELYICYDQIVKQAREFQINTKEEFMRMLSHGMLHLVGYDHVKEDEAKKMFRIQEKIVSSVKK